MIQKEDSPERRQLAQDLVKSMLGLLDLADLNHVIRRHGMEILQREIDGCTVFSVFMLKPRRHQIDTFIFSGDPESLDALTEDEPGCGIYSSSCGTFGTFGDVGRFLS